MRTFLQCMYMSSWCRCHMDPAQKETNIHCKTKSEGITNNNACMTI